MLSSLLLSSLVAAGAAQTQSVEPHWSVHGLEDRKPVESLETDLIMASVRTEEGPAIALVCSEQVGLQTIYVYEPEADLTEQIFKTQNFLRRKDSTVSVGDSTFEEAWLWKRRHGTLQAKTSSTGVKVLNAAFSEKDISFNFEGMDAVTVSLPKAGKEMMSFVNNCSTTRVRSADAD